MSNAPANFNDDVTGVVAGSHIYYFRGSNTPDFYRYTPATDTWAELADTPANVRYGGSLAYPGSGDYIYGTRGASTAAFWRYSISGNTWDDGGSFIYVFGFRHVLYLCDRFAFTIYLLQTDTRQILACPETLK